MISIIIPIYNTAMYLPEMLRCLSAQTERDLEIILVNDGSTDESADICLAAAQEDPRIAMFIRRMQAFLRRGIAH